MPSRPTDQDYSPRFKVGEVVTILAGLAQERTATITHRKVRRSGKGDTFYTFDDGSQAWEWALQATSDLVPVTVAVERILRGFGLGERNDRLSYWKVETTRMRDDQTSARRVHVHLEARTAQVGRVARVDFHTWTDPDKPDCVQTVGPWEWVVMDMAGSDVNLGAAIVSTYNLSLRYEDDGQ